MRGVFAAMSAQAQGYDLVILNGRVIDPESKLDAVRYVGFKDGKIAAVTQHAITGKETIDAKGHVVADYLHPDNYHKNMGRTYSDIVEVATMTPLTKERYEELLKTAPSTSVTFVNASSGLNKISPPTGSIISCDYSGCFEICLNRLTKMCFYANMSDHRGRRY